MAATFCPHSLYVASKITILWTFDFLYSDREKPIAIEAHGRSGARLTSNVEFGMTFELDCPQTSIYFQNHLRQG